MCGRTTLVASAELVARWLGLPVPEWEPRYNLCPGQDMLVVRLGRDREPEVLRMRWGLIPSWATDTRIAFQCINARAETVATKPAFRENFERRRCLIIVDGWYEWATGTRARRQPYAIRMPTGAPFAFAGLWDRWRAPDTGEWLTTCTIVTTVTGEATAHLHHRMPVVLNRDQMSSWIDPRTPSQTLHSMLQPFAGTLAVFPVSKVVNAGKVDDSRCLEPMGAPPSHLDLDLFDPS